MVSFYIYLKIKYGKDYTSKLRDIRTWLMESFIVRRGSFSCIVLL